jgi:two-component system, chemotaxis family, chemotaxis protein CheY
MQTNLRSFERLLNTLAVLIADGDVYARRITGSMLMQIGVRSIREVSDGIAALAQIRSWNPDVMLLDCDLPGINGVELTRKVRTPGISPRSDLPIILLSRGISRSQVIEAMKVGANDLLVMPTSPKMLYDHLRSALIKPRPLVKIGEKFVPKRSSVSPSEANANSVVSTDETEILYVK